MAQPMNWLTRLRAWVAVNGTPTDWTPEMVELATWSTWMHGEEMPDEERRRLVACVTNGQDVDAIMEGA